MLKIKALSKPPIYDNGYILYAAEDKEIIPNCTNLVKAGFQMSLPSDYCGVITSYNKINCIGGLIDSDYRGEVGVLVVTDTNFKVERGGPIAKMRVLKISTPILKDTTDYTISFSQTH